jgi:predicted N-acetyltransferase YhbS
VRLLEATLRTLRYGEEETLLRILESAYGSFHNDTDVRALLSSRCVDSSHFFEPDSCFIAEENGLPVGSVVVTSLPRHNWFVIRYLAVAQREKRTEIAERLLAKTVDYMKSRKSEHVRATTPPIEPYIGGLHFLLSGLLSSGSLAVPKVWGKD